jgi:hypothetical protein
MIMPAVPIDGSGNRRSPGLILCELHETRQRQWPRMPPFRPMRPRSTTTPLRFNLRASPPERVPVLGARPLQWARLTPEASWKRIMMEARHRTAVNVQLHSAGFPPAPQKYFAANGLGIAVLIRLA